MNKKLLLIISSLLLFAGANAQQTYTLQQCIDIALENNRQVKQQSLAKQERDIAYRQARQDLLPNLNASAGQDFTFGRSPDATTTYRSGNSTQTSFNIASNLTLFDGLRMKHNIDARRAETYASAADLEKAKADIVMAVNTAYLQVLMNKELLQTAENQLFLTKELIVQRQKLIEAGKLAEGEMFELQAQEAKEDLSRVQAENALKLSLLDLAQIMEIDSPLNPPQGDFDVLPQSPPVGDLGGLYLRSVEETYASALQSRPEMKSASYKLQSSEKNVSIARAGYFPTLTFGANFRTGYNSLENMSFNKQLSEYMSGSVGFNLNIPIFNRFDTKNRVATAKLGVENSKLELENTKKELFKTIQQAHQNALAAKERWKAAEKSVKATQEAYRYAEQKYDSGRATQYEIFQVKNNYSQVLSEQTQAKFEYAFRVRILELLK